MGSILRIRVRGAQSAGHPVTWSTGLLVSWSLGLLVTRSLGRLVTFLLLLSASFALQAQSTIGQWSDHLPFARAIDLEDAPDRIYCATQSGLFSYDKRSAAISKWSKVSGLSDVNISCIAYSEDHHTLVIAYANSNIDLMTNHQIINIPDIKRKQITGSKRVNSIQVIGDKALLSCGFGIIALDLVKKEVSSTFYIGQNGQHIEVFETLTFNYDSIFAATEKGIFKAFIQHSNLEDYRNWEMIPNQPFTGESWTQMAYLDGRLWASHRSSGNGVDSIYTYDGHRWTWFPWYFKDIRKMHFQRDNLVVISEFQINVFGPDATRRYHLSDYEYKWMNAYDVLMDDFDGFWIGDQFEGLLYTEDGTEVRSMRPEGPWDRKNFSLTVSEGNLWIATGGVDASWTNIWNNSGVSAKIDGVWTVLNPTTVESMPEIRDITLLAVDPADPAHVFGASWGYGVIEFLDGEFVKIHDDTNTGGALQNIYPGNPYVRIGGIDFDSKGNLWVSNSSVPNPVSVLKTDGTWQSFSYGQYLGDAFAGQLLVTPGDIKWIQLPKGFGLFAFYNGNNLEDLSDDKVRKININVTYPGGSMKILNDIYSMAVDLDGELWVGTSNGVVVYYAPGRVFDQADFRGYQPSVDQGDSLYHALLGTETITAIAVDGANRKWFGTKNSGVYLTNPEGTQLITSFNETNSPLLSNAISSIAIDQQNGEVYFGTEAGVVSYRGSAIYADPNFTEAYAFPNPVRPGYQGLITIRGVPAEAAVKVVDVSGGLVYETTSLGGQALWDGNNRKGEPAASGVYLVLASTSQGGAKQIAKILIIR